ncbi:DUF917 domain-containing protein [Sphaerisporangium sp. TRM90804]|uniref:DUF917 domain-containing protein n=1 Tax=Sphaerisporangium sp. TRM90804 TaxID=3031113 RepID=UPI002447AF89|nr:DUF917 domain-containing protein [Sphaerisporangium sp. TRM90804]MDH2424995.1 DUF917 domain-containing protein [Sphaerisporangium sp. TRM90804]
MAFTLTEQGLRDLAEGAAVLGTGGGGDPHIGRLLVQQQLRAGREVRVIGVDELPGDALVVPSAMMGAPTVFIEKLPSGRGNIAALRALEARLGRAAAATMPTESGGLNSMIPLLLGAQLGLPVVDADGMGRAFPELQMETWNVYGVPGSPMAIASDHGDHCVIDTGQDNLLMERRARAMTVEMGGAAYICDYPMDAATVRRTSIPGTLTLAMKIGAALRRARQDHADPFERLTGALKDTIYSHGLVLFAGKVVDVERRTVAGFARGQVTLEGDAGRMTLTFQNEHLVARHGGRVAAIVPDLICTLNSETGAPVTTESLAYGQRLTVFAISTPALMRTPEALACFGPSAFGLPDPYVPVERLPLSAV